MIAQRPWETARVNARCAIIWSPTTQTLAIGRRPAEEKKTMGVIEPASVDIVERLKSEAAFLYSSRAHRLPQFCRGLQHVFQNRDLLKMAEKKLHQFFKRIFLGVIGIVSADRHFRMRRDHKAQPVATQNSRQFLHMAFLIGKVLKILRGNNQIERTVRKLQALSVHARIPYTGIALSSPFDSGLRNVYADDATRDFGEMRSSVSSSASNIDHVFLDRELLHKAVNLKMILEVTIRDVRINSLSPEVVTRTQKAGNAQTFVSYFVHEDSGFHRQSNFHQ